MGKGDTLLRHIEQKWQPDIGLLQINWHLCAEEFRMRGPCTMTVFPEMLSLLFNVHSASLPLPGQ